VEIHDGCCGEVSSVRGDGYRKRRIVDAP
jgi:hypothetical protein